MPPEGRRKEPDHGTTRGYMQHRRREEPACGHCLQAWSDYNSRMSRKRRRETRNNKETK